MGRRTEEGRAAVVILFVISVFARVSLSFSLSLSTKPQWMQVHSLAAVATGCEGGFVCKRALPRASRRRDPGQAVELDKELVVHHFDERIELWVIPSREVGQRN